MLEKNKILVILGPTATGKSDLAVKLAKKYNGEVISADSRQVYKGLNIGTGKITKKEMAGIPHHILDVKSPKQVYSVAEWQKEAKKIITDILSRGKLPIICGGTGFYIQSIVDNVVLPEVPPNKLLRKKLEKKNLAELVTVLKKLDPNRAKNIDLNNPVRLIRAIEIATALGVVPTLTTLRQAQGKKAQGKNSTEFLQIGLNLPEAELKTKIHNRLLSRIRAGMVTEANKLHKNGLSWKRMQQLGLEYRYLADYINGVLNKKGFIQKLEAEIWHYAKRQMTWFKRDKNIKWYSPTETVKIDKVVRKFIT